MRQQKIGRVSHTHAVENTATDYYVLLPLNYSFVSFTAITNAQKL